MNRRSCAIALAAVFCLAGAGHSASQATVDELIAKNIQARGGLARLKAITTVVQTATQNVQGMAVTATTYLKRPRSLRTELNVGGKVIINAYDGDLAWIQNPLAGMIDPVVITGPQADMIREQPGMDGPLVDYRTQGYTIAVDGMETMGERNLVHLRLTRKQQVSHLFLDAETFLEAKEMNETGQFKLEKEFLDYRDVDGVKWPFHIRILANGVLQSEVRVEKVEFNAAIDDAKFRLPKGS